MPPGGERISASLYHAQRVLQHGQHIFVYNNIRTNQVVYSLKRTLKNNDSLRQLPYLGKKTVPAALRKDLWLPLATISFPSSSQGLTAYRKLREYRKLHETAYPLELITQTEGKNAGTLLGKKKRGKVLMDQKANSVADMAAVMQHHEDDAKRLAKEAGSSSAKRRTGGETDAEVGGLESVKIRWSNILDAQYAATWPATVVHAELKKERYAAADPMAPEIPTGLLGSASSSGPLEL